jgi:hypothetical protein
MKQFNENKPIKADFTNGDTALQGDVIIHLFKLPNEFKSLEKIKDDCIAYGEFTGHCHKLFDGEFELKQTSEGVKFLKVVKDVCLKHQEHNPLIIPPGEYKIEIQREYDPFTKLIRNVHD